MLIHECINRETGLLWRLRKSFPEKVKYDSKPEEWFRQRKQYFFSSRHVGSTFAGTFFFQLCCLLAFFSRILLYLNINSDPSIPIIVTANVY